MPQCLSRRAFLLSSAALAAVAPLTVLPGAEAAPVSLSASAAPAARVLTLDDFYLVEVAAGTALRCAPELAVRADALELDAAFASLRADWCDPSGAVWDVLAWGVGEVARGLPNDAAATYRALAAACWMLRRAASGRALHPLDFPAADSLLDAASLSSGEGLKPVRDALLTLRLADRVPSFGGPANRSLIAAYEGLARAFAPRVGGEAMALRSLGDAMFVAVHDRYRYGPELQRAARWGSAFFELPPID